MGVKPWSVPLQVVVGLRREQICEAVSENKFLSVLAHDLLLLRPVLDREMNITGKVFQPEMFTKAMIAL